MNYFKGALSGFGAVLLGCLLTPFALIVRGLSTPSQGEPATVSFSPMGLEHHMAHSPGFWAFIVVLFTAGFLPFVLLRKR